YEHDGNCCEERRLGHFRLLRRSCVANSPSTVSGAEVGASPMGTQANGLRRRYSRSEEHTSELQSRFDLVCRLLLEKKKAYSKQHLSRYQIISFGINNQREKLHVNLRNTLPCGQYQIGVEFLSIFARIVHVTDFFVS